jgi:two-component system, OmpR family, response regulator
MPGMGNILVVEDDDSIRTLLVETFEDEGYTVRSASDRMGMHMALDTQPPDLLICDVDLDRGVDPTLIDDVRATHGAAMPLLLLTTNVWAARSLARQGLTFCLLKPFHLEELLTSVASLIHPYERSV